MRLPRLSTSYNWLQNEIACDARTGSSGSALMNSRRTCASQLARRAAIGQRLIGVRLSDSLIKSYVFRCSRHTTVSRHTRGNGPLAPLLAPSPASGFYAPMLPYCFRPCRSTVVRGLNSSLPFLAAMFL